MEQKQRTIRRRERPEGPSGESAGSTSTSLLERARGWGVVAREAYDDCERGSEAEAEVLRRRNRPGQ